MEAREGIGQVAPDGELPPEQVHGIALTPEMESDPVVSSKTQPPFPPVLTYPLCQETVER